ncbi:MAG: hypothetical protein HY544_00225 [Candidatus Diapherotrites archaeon]|uniref:Uncharacterized protein n=1 Tax=Candidatus Iainarchaeum sp. TaxID=3101447 RepID=A0A8T3YI36_9ARCH|nr:hypothetical protein [Candidatus Diapherotrites archaeon]
MAETVKDLIAREFPNRGSKLGNIFGYYQGFFKRRVTGTVTPEDRERIELLKGIAGNPKFERKLVQSAEKAVFLSNERMSPEQRVKNVLISHLIGLKIESLTDKEQPLFGKYILRVHNNFGTYPESMCQISIYDPELEIKSGLGIAKVGTVGLNFHAENIGGRNALVASIATVQGGLPTKERVRKDFEKAAKQPYPIFLNQLGQRICASLGIGIMRGIPMKEHPLFWKREFKTGKRNPETGKMEPNLYDPNFEKLGFRPPSETGGGFYELRLAERPLREKRVKVHRPFFPKEKPDIRRPRA